MSDKRERHDTDKVPTYLIAAAAAILLLGFVGGIATRPTATAEDLQRNGESWPPAPSARPADAPPE